MHRKPMTRCASSLLPLLSPSVLVAACDVQPIGDLGHPVLEVRLLVEEVYPDRTTALPFALWRVGDEVSIAATGVLPSTPAIEPAPPWQPLTLGIFSTPVVEPGDVARLDLFYGSYTVDDDGTPTPTSLADGPLATTRSTVWFAPGGLDRVDVPLPFDVDAYVAAMTRSSTAPPAFAPLLDNPDRAARTCGEEAAASCSGDDDEGACDIVTGVGAADCCVAAHEAFAACEAVVADVDGGAVARLRWSDACCG